MTPYFNRWQCIENMFGGKISNARKIIIVIIISVANLFVLFWVLPRYMNERSLQYHSVATHEKDIC